MEWNRKSALTVVELSHFEPDVWYLEPKRTNQTHRKQNPSNPPKKITKLLFAPPKKLNAPEQLLTELRGLKGQAEGFRSVWRLTSGEMNFDQLEILRRESALLVSRQNVSDLIRIQQLLAGSPKQQKRVSELQNNSHSTSSEDRKQKRVSELHNNSHSTSSEDRQNVSRAPN